MGTKCLVLSEMKGDQRIRVSELKTNVPIRSNYLLIFPQIYSWLSI